MFDVVVGSGVVVVAIVRVVTGIGADVLSVLLVSVLTVVPLSFNDEVDDSDTVATDVEDSGWGAG